MRYKIGIITNTFGLNGEVIVRKTTDFDRFVKDKEIYLIDNDLKVNLKIKKVSNYKKSLRVKFYNIDSIVDIEKYKGMTLYTNETPTLEEDEYHEKDIIGLKVYNQEEIYIGEVISVMDVPQGHILKVQTDEKVALVPFNNHFIIEVNKEFIVINEIEGLIWKLM